MRKQSAGKHSVGVVIVNHNACSHLRLCAASVREQQREDVVVIDVASTDGSSEMIRNEHSWARCIELAGNPGFGSAANHGVRQLTCEYVLILNSDTVLMPGTVAALRNCLDLQPRVGLLGPRLVNPDGTYQRSCRRFPGTAAWLIDNPVVGRMASRLPVARYASLRAWRHDSRRDVPWVIGAALFVRRKAFDQVGGFSSNYFMYYEDIDLCFRLRAAGWAVHFTPDASVLHVGAVSTAHYSERMTAELHRSARVFYRTSYGRLRASILIGLDGMMSHL